MEQLLLHLLGDYVTQTQWMAQEKTKQFKIALLHAAVYATPFILFLPISFLAFMVIFITHAVIDHYRLARFLIFFKNRTTDRSLKWHDCKDTGSPSSLPAYLSVWLMIIVDNALHLSINYAAIRWL